MKKIFASFLILAVSILMAAPLSAKTGDSTKSKTFKRCDKVYMYTLTHCPACISQKKVLDEAGIPYIELDAQKSKKYARALRDKANNLGWRQIGYPTLEVNGELIQYPATPEQIIEKAC